MTGDEVPGFAPVKRAQSLRLNELYLAKRIDYFDGGVDVCIVLTLDGQVIGKADFMKTSHAQWKLPEGNPGGDESLYIMCDLAVASDVEKRLAKLVLLLLTSREVKEWVDAKLNKRVGWVITTAFAKGPVSMKYRGCFQLYSRKQDKKTGSTPSTTMPRSERGRLRNHSHSGRKNISNSSNKITKNACMTGVIC